MQIIYTILGITGVLLLIYAFFIEPIRLHVSRTEVRIPGLPQELDGFTICHISDTHSIGYDMVEKIMNKELRKLSADLCVITGDLVQNYEALKTYGRIFQGFKPKLGFYAVPGNGEHKWQLDIYRVSAMLAASGINLLQNNSSFILTNGCSINIIGVDDPFLALSDIESARDGLVKADLDLLLAHSPDILSEIKDYKPDLLLAGHTHGGQIRLPLLGAFWLHCRHSFLISHGYFGPEQLSTLTGKDMSDMHMYVSRGIGASLVQARFLCSPEIAIIILRG
ncbi:MAG: metallophosphoesterase [Armatimonadota bacterium]